MSKTLHQLTHDAQTRIRELAYVMWESAGRQQGMALDYWLAAEKEVLSTFQAAAEMILPMVQETAATVSEAPAKQSPKKVAATKVEPAPSAVETTPIPDPVTPKETKSAAAKVTTKPATRRTTTRSKANA